MNERPCIRGCTHRGQHMPTCPEPKLAETYEKAWAAGVRNIAYSPKCSGCLPVQGRVAMMLCDRCYRRLRSMLEDAPDLLAHLRSIVDPMKAAVYDKVMVSSSRKEMPAPVAADLIDASADIAKTLHEWAAFVDPTLAGAPIELSRLDTAEVFDAADWWSMVILARLESLANRIEVRELADVVLTHHTGEPEWWSIADALTRYPLNDRPRYATAPCPECDTKSVWVSPPRRVGQDFRYVCKACDWEANDHDDDGLWGNVFSGVAA